MTRRYRTVRNKGVIAAAKVQRRTPGEPRLSFRIDRTTRRFIRPMAIVVLASAFAVALLSIIRTAHSDNTWMVAAILCVFAALEGTYTTTWLVNPDSQGVDRTFYRVAEVLFLLVIVRIFSWLLFGQGVPSPVEMRLFLTDPLSLVLYANFVTTAAVTLVTWWFATSISRTFTRLDISVYEHDFYTRPHAEQKELADNQPIRIGRDELKKEYLRNALTVGLIMVLLAAISTYQVRQLATVRSPFEVARLGLQPAMLFALLAYLMSGLWLLSHARMLHMNARWLIDGIAKDVDLEHSWQRSVALTLLITAVLALFLPIGSTLAISRILSLGLSGVAYLIGTVYKVMGYLFGSALLALTRNLQESPPERFTLPPLPPVPPVSPEAAQSMPNPLLTMIISFLFWALLIGFIVASAAYYLRERGVRVGKLQPGGSWSAMLHQLKRLWIALRKRLGRLGRGLSDRFQTASKADTPAVASPKTRSRLLRPGSLSPRDQVRHYYLAFLRLAAERGHGRPESATPLEFGRELTKVWPEGDHADIEGMTRAFTEARYSSRPVGDDAAAAAKASWKRLRARLSATR